MHPILSILPLLAVAQPAPQPAVQLTPSPLRTSLTLGGQHTFASDLESDQGEVEVTRAAFGLDLGYQLSPQWGLGLAVDNELSWYDFDDATNVLGRFERRFDDVSRTTISPSVRYSIDAQWTAFAAGLLTFTGESDADVGDSIVGGGTVGVRYAFSKNFALSGGLIATSRLEDDALVLPFVGVEWRINDRVTLASRGLGLELAAKVADPLTVTLGLEYASRAYRLADDGAVPDGVLQDRRVPVAVGLRYAPARWIEVTVRGGVDVWQEYTIDDSGGQEIEEVETDPSPFVGASIEFRF